MSLVSLKKHALSVESVTAKTTKSVDIDSFINDAVVYANGGDISNNDNVVVFNLKQSEVSATKPLKRATFTLGEETIAMLGGLAEDAQVSKSKLLRLLIACHAKQSANC